MVNSIVFHVPESGGYTVVELNDEEVYRGVDTVGPIIWELFAALCIEYTTLEYKDNLYEEKFG
jgi:hypothetical protein